ncbi:MAG: hypothetical protein E4H33_01300 [Anaerolineales bacterium]|nr:MAG: hypothetical protein E4H33_01300 [Anaerolineales bacterium]
MKSYWKELLFGSTLALLFGGLLMWLISTPPTSTLSIFISVLTFLIGIITFIIQIRRKKEDITKGTPAEDEYGRLAKVFSGNQAFHYSYYLWVIIFIFNSSFSKNETMLGVGILGSALIYGLSLWYHKSSGDFNA